MKTALGAFALLVLLSGCGGSEIIDPVIEIPEECSVIVVPFRDEQFANGFESPRGTALAERVLRTLKDKGDFRVKSMEVLLKLYEKDPRNMTARQVAEETRADYVVMGDVTHWATQDDKVYGLLRGSSTIEISIYETEQAARKRTPDEDEADLPKPGSGRLAVAKKKVTAIFPQEYGRADIGTYEMSVPEIEAGLMNSTATAVAWLLVEHTKEEARLAAAK